jgi:small subunit ribosomal protein S11
MKSGKGLISFPVLPWACSRSRIAVCRSHSCRSFTKSTQQLADEEKPQRTRRSPLSQDLLGSSMHREILGSMANSSQSNIKTSSQRKKSRLDPAAALDNAFDTSRGKPRGTESISPLDYQSSVLNPENNIGDEEEKIPHHFHILTHRHNTHITLTKPNRDPLISVSTGNIGIRKGKRGEYDSAYQLTAYVLSRIQDQGLLAEIERLELVMRGFGKGRDAVTKAIMGSEGRIIRKKIIRVTDSTRLKFGGTRSRKPRRL